MAFVIAIIFLVVISVVFHLLTPWWLTPIASNWGTIDDTINITFLVTGFVFVVVNLFMAYAVYRFRYNRKRRSQYEPENKKLELWLSVITAVGVAGMLAPGLFVWADFVSVPEEADTVEIIAQQWQWSFRYPGEDGVLGIADTRFITPDNPFGIDPDDPSGLDDVLVDSQEMHLPLDRPVRLLLRSKDVLHNYAVPQFRVKMDMIPGSVTFLWLTPTRSGTFDILCEELCGIGHHIMRGTVVVEAQQDFDTWLAEQVTYGDTLAQLAGDAEAGQTRYALCGTCHGVQGEGNPVMNGPKLAGQEPWYLRRQLTYFKSGVRGGETDDQYGVQMAPMAATLATDEAMNDVIAYIQTLEDEPAVTTISGNVERGRKLYRPTCAICHGTEGDGVWSVSAPRLVGMSDWYLKRELQNFKTGQRGKHSSDEFGFQMTSMVSALANEQDINDVVAYINTLR